MNSEITVVILAAGLGTRMRSEKAKVLHEAGGDTLLNHVIKAAMHVAPAERIVVVVGNQAERVQRSVTESGTRFEGIRFAIQGEQLGTGHAMLCARTALPTESGSILILNGDGPLLKPGTLVSLAEQQSASHLAGCLVTTELADPTGYGRIARDPDGNIAAIIEQKAAAPEQLRLREINTGLYCFDATSFWRHITDIHPNQISGEYYLTDIVEILREHGHAVRPFLVKDETELLGINTRIELAVADKILRTRKAEALMLSGVTIEMPETVAIDADVEVGQDTTIEAHVQLRGKTRIGSGCRIGTGSVLRDCQVDARVTLFPYVVAETSFIGADSYVGPFARLRLNAHAAERTAIGNFVELKKTNLGAGSKANHLAYLGDAEIGSGVNIGAGTITCNFDGKSKFPTHIGDNVFVGSNSTLVAPVDIGGGAYVAAASVITKNVEPDSLAIGRARQVDKAGWAKRRREQKL